MGKEMQRGRTRENGMGLIKRIKEFIVVGSGYMDT